VRLSSVYENQAVDNERKNRVLRRIIGTVAIGAICTVGFTAYGFTASNTVPNSTAGDGTSVVSGYTATAVAYTLNAATPTNIDNISFTIAPITAATVKAKANGVWYACVNVAGAVNCTTTAPQLTVAPVTTLEVLAIQ